VSRAYSDGLVVILRDAADFEPALRRFKKAVRATGLLAEIARKQWYEAPAVAKRRKRARAAARRARAARRERSVDWKPPERTG
jgi:ribosomal protein S21